MRIVLASFASLPNSVGGGEVHVYQLAKALKALGHTPSLLAVEKTGVASVASRTADLDGIQVDLLEVPSAVSPYERDPQLSEWAGQWLKEQRVDVVHLFLFSHLLGLLPAARNAGIPVCMTALEFSYFCRRYDLMYEGREQCSLNRRASVCEQCVLSSYSGRQRFAANMATVLPVPVESRLRSMVSASVGDRLPSLGQRRITQLIEDQRKHLPEELAAIITPSTVMHDFYLAQGASPAQLHRIPYGTEVQNPGSRRTGSKLRFGYIGRFDPLKGVDLLCEAAQMISSDLDFELSIYGPRGEDTFYERIRRLANGDKRIKLRGKLDRDSIRKAYEEIDVLIVPSIWYENSPITISEALSSGCAVVCSDTLGMKDLIEDGKNGLMFPAGDKERLAATMEGLILDRKLVSRLRENTKPVETSTQVARSMVTVYQQVCRMQASVAS